MPDDMDLEQAFALPNLESLSIVYINGKSLSMANYLRLMTVFDFIVKFAPVFMEDEDIEDWQLDQFELSLTTHGDLVWLFDLMIPFVHYALPKNMPEASMLTLQALWGMFLRAQDAELALMVEQQEFHMVPLEKKLDALECLITWLYDHELLLAHVQGFADRKVDMINERLERKKLRNVTAVDVTVAELELKDAKIALETQKEAYEAYLAQLALDVENDIKDFVEGRESAGQRVMERQLDQKRQSLMDARREKSDMQKAMLNSMEHKIVSIQKRLENLEAQKAELNEELKEDNIDELALKPIRNQDCIYLGADRFGRYYWHFFSLGGILVESDMSPEREYFLLSKQDDLAELEASLNRLGSRESHLRRSIVLHRETLVESFETAQEWKRKHTEQAAAITITESDFAHTQFAQLQELIVEMEETLQTMGEFEHAEHEFVPNFSLLTKFQLKPAAEEAETLMDLIRCVEKFFAPFSNHFFTPRPERLIYNLLIGAASEEFVPGVEGTETRTVSFWKWYQSLHSMKTVSSLALYVINMHQSFQRLLETLESRYGARKLKRSDSTALRSSLRKPKSVSATEGRRVAVASRAVTGRSLRQRQASATDTSSRKSKRLDQAADDAEEVGRITKKRATRTGSSRSNGRCHSAIVDSSSGDEAEEEDGSFTLDTASSLGSVSADEEEEEEDENVRRSSRLSRGRS